MENRTRLLGIVLATGLMGCANAPDVPSPQPTEGVHLPSAIAQFTQPLTPLQTLSEISVNTTIYIEGTVQQTAPLLGSWVYQVADETGTVWVRSPEAPPAVGTPVRIQGVVRYEPIVIGDTDVGEFYLEEAARAVLEPAADAEP